MLVVISDLHFEEERRDWIGTPGAPGSVGLARNFSPEAWRKFSAWLRAQAKPGQRVDVALAGDIFDLHRTAAWFDDAIRPWDSPARFKAGSRHEAKVLAILDAIAAEPDVKASLEVIAALPQNVPGAHVHYLSGNHDRLANATERVRDRARGLLGIAPSPDGLRHSLLFADPPVLVRHGHEYDPFNFAADLTAKPIPLDVPEQAYRGATLGDFITVEVASRLPVLFRAHHGDETIRNNPDLRQIYLRLLEFDDVRPQSALLEFLLRIPGMATDEEHLWDYLKPVVRELLDGIADHPFLHAWLDRLDRHYTPELVDLIQLGLHTKPWRLGLPLWLARKLATAARSSGDAVVGRLVSTVAREKALGDKLVRAVIAGHTHEPQVALLDASAGIERYYIDTGTWRNRVPSTQDAHQFGRLKALTYVVVYGKDEDPGAAPPPPGQAKVWSFDYWTGFTQRWWG